MKKAISRAFYRPADGLGNSVPPGLRGAGYDDYDNNANRNSDGAGQKGAKPPAWRSISHQELRTSVADKISKCKWGLALNKLIAVFGGAPVALSNLQLRKLFGRPVALKSVGDSAIANATGTGRTRDHSHF